MTDNQFDQFVRAKLQDHSAPVPAGLWDKVNPARDDDDRKVIVLPPKNRYGLPVLLGLLIAASITGYLLLRADGTASNTSGTGAEAQTAATGATLNNKPANEPAAASALSQQSNSKTTNQDQQSSNTLNPSAAVTLATTAPVKSAGEAQPVSNPHTTSTDNNTSHLQTNAGSDLNNTTVNSKRSRFDNAALMNTSLKGGSHSAQTVPNTRNNALSLSATSKDEEPATTEAAEAAVWTVNPYLAPGSLVQAYQPGDQVMNSLKSLKENAAAHSKSFKSVIICPTDKNRNTDWFAEVYVSPDAAFKSFRNINASAQYLAKKDSSEHMQPGFTAGVRLVKPITDNFLIKTGLQYSQINQKFTYRTENEVRTITVISVRTIVRAPGDTITVTDTSTAQQFGYKNNSIRNRYRSIDVPLILGYQFGGDNLKFGINAGVIFNLSSWYQGVILDTSLTAVPISKGSNMLYKSNIGLGLYAGFSIMKQLGENTQLFFEPYFRYNLSNMTNSNASFSQKFSLGGLSIGLRYNLKRQ
jgi:hypothetical protein